MRRFIKKISTAPPWHQDPRLAIKLPEGEVVEAEEKHDGSVPEQLHAQIAKRVGAKEYTAGWTIRR